MGYFCLTLFLYLMIGFIFFKFSYFYYYSYFSLKLMGILPSNSCVSTTVQLYHLNCNEIPEEKARWEPHKNAACCFKQIQCPIKQQLYGHLSPILQIIQVRWARLTRHHWRSRGELISNFDGLLYMDTWLTSKNLIFITGCHLEDLSKVMTDGDG